MTKKRAAQILQDYVNNDCEISDFYTVRDALLAVADEYEIRELGLGRYLDDEGTENDQ